MEADDGQLALLVSVLEPQQYPSHILLAALKKSRGDVGAAAETILLNGLDTEGASSSRGTGTAGLANGRVDVSSPSTTRSSTRTKHKKGAIQAWLRGGGGDGDQSRKRKRRPSFSACSGADEDDPVGRYEPKGEGNSRLSNSLSDGTDDLSDEQPIAMATETPTTTPRQTPAPLDLSKLLRPVSSVPARAARNRPRPALLLTSQAAIDAHHLPLTVIPSPLPPTLASALYLTMVKESEEWTSHKWFLAGKWVESPHLMSGYARSGGGFGDPEHKSKYYYSGMDVYKEKDYPDLLKVAADIIEPIVNNHLSRRPRHPLEYAGQWRGNVCGANRYDGASSTVGWHADQLSYLGPHTTIASLSLGTPRAFRLRETQVTDPAFEQDHDQDGKARGDAGIRTYELKLAHNSLVLMNAGCQERFKHTIPPQKALDLYRPGWDMEQVPIPPHEQKTYTTRINITFRFYREDFHPLPGIGPNGPRQGTPICKCGIPALLRADQKAKARSRLVTSSPKRVKYDPTKPTSPNRSTNGCTTKSDGHGLIDDDMAFFWQCQSPGQTGTLKGCGFFKILDMKAEGRGPCIIDKL